MPRLTLDFHGASVSLESDDAAVLADLRRDFAAFEASPGSEAVVRLRLCGKACALPRGTALWGWRDFRASAGSRTRLIRWDDGSWAHHDRGGLEAEIHAREPGRLRELAYLAVLSRAGEELDRRGLHRVHALGFTYEGRAGLVLLPSRGGKSSLALEMLKRGEPGLLSDESPIVSRDGLVRPFPLRLALREREALAGAPAAAVSPFKRRGYAEKFTVAPEALGAGFAAGAPLRWLFAGSRTPGAPRFSPLPLPHALAALGSSMVVGVGLTQMAEYMLRADPRLAGIAASRLKAAVSLARRADARRFDLGSEGPAAALDALLAGLREPGKDAGAAPR